MLQINEICLGSNNSGGEELYKVRPSHHPALTVWILQMSLIKNWRVVKSQINYWYILTQWAICCYEL